MNKKANIITIVSLKTYLILGAIGIGLYLLYYFFVLHSAGVISLPTFCPRGIIPDRISNISCSYSSGCWYLPDIPSGQDLGGYDNYGTKGLPKWEDGTEFYFSSVYGCPLGDKRDQNINYAYCKDARYYNKPIMPDGTIGKEINLKIDLIIDTKDKTEQGYKVISYNCKS
jgi:hypothetical protein